MPAPELLSPPLAATLERLAVRECTAAAITLPRMLLPPLPPALMSTAPPGTAPRSFRFAAEALGASVDGGAAAEALSSGPAASRCADCGWFVGFAAPLEGYSPTPPLPLFCRDGGGNSSPDSMSRGEALRSPCSARGARCPRHAPLPPRLSTDSVSRREAARSPPAEDNRWSPLPPQEPKAEEPEDRSPSSSLSPAAGFTDSRPPRAAGQSAGVPAAIAVASSATRAPSAWPTKTTRFRPSWPASASARRAAERRL